MPHLPRRVLSTASLLGLVLTQQACASSSPSGGDSAPAASSSAAAPSAVPSPAVASSASSGSAPTAGDASLPDEDTQVLIHIASVDKDWEASYEGPIDTGDGTGDGSLFRLRPATGGAYQIQALRFREEDGEWCAVAYDETDAIDKVSTKECGENKFTLFTIEPTGSADEKGRPTFTIVNAELGAVTFDVQTSTLTMQQGTPATAYSFVDRGEAVLQGED